MCPWLLSVGLFRLFFLFMVKTDSEYIPCCGEVRRVWRDSAPSVPVSLLSSISSVHLRRFYMSFLSISVSWVWSYWVCCCAATCAATIVILLLLCLLCCQVHVLVLLFHLRCHFRHIRKSRAVFLSTTALLLPIPLKFKVSTCTARGFQVTFCIVAIRPLISQSSFAGTVSARTVASIQ